MSEAKKLSEQQLELIRVRYSGDGSPLGMLIDHIDAITAEHEAAMTRAREDADRVGKARIEFEVGQQKQIEVLATALHDISEYCVTSLGGIEWDDTLRKIDEMVLQALEKANGPG